MDDIIVKQQFSVSTNVLWNAITEQGQMIQWFFENIPNFNPKVGFKTQFLIENNGRKFTHLWEIVEIVETQKIIYNWSYLEYPGKGFVSFELIENELGSFLTLTNKWIDDLPKDIPEFSRESCLGGWQYFINGRLKDYLGNK